MFAQGFRGRSGLSAPPPSLALTATHDDYTTDGKTVSASSDQSSPYTAWHTFSKVPVGVSPAGNAWYTAAPHEASPYLQYDFGSGKTVTRYEITDAGNGTDYSIYTPISWVLYGSNTGAFSGEEDTPDSQTSLAAWGNRETRSFDIASPASYRYYRIVFVRPSSGLTAVGEVEYYGY